MDFYRHFVNKPQISSSMINKFNKLMMVFINKTWLPFSRINTENSVINTYKYWKYLATSNQKTEFFLCLCHPHKNHLHTSLPPPGKIPKKILCLKNNIVRRASHRYWLKYVYSALGLLAVHSLYIYMYKYPWLPIGYASAKGV